jgi:hypothetical protein
MTIIDIESILGDIQKTISNNKDNYENLLDFIVAELCKSKITINDNILELLANNVESKYYTKEETKELLSNKLTDALTIQSFATTIQEQNSHHNSNHINFMPNFIDKQILNSIEKNKNLWDVSDPILHFNKRHMSFLSRIFYLQITQNYLSALKWFFTRDLIEKQTKFNSAIDDGIKNLIETLHVIERNHEISINEQKNYVSESIKDIENRQHDLDIKLIENHNELKEIIISRDLKTTEFFLEKIFNIEKMITEIKDKNQKSEKS